MKTLINNNLLIIMLFTTLFLFSCEDVIELDLKNSEPQIVIEAKLDAGEQELEVIVSQSNGFYDQSDQALLDGARVILQDENGKIYEALSAGAGKYYKNGIEVVPGEKLTIEVEYNDKIYTATALAPTAAKLDSVNITDMERPGPGFGNHAENEFKLLTAYWKDKGGIDNYYRIMTTRNDTLEAQQFSMEKDDVRDGLEMMLAIRNPYQIGNNVKVELLSVNPEYFTYFTQLSSNLADGFNSTTPFNPESNFDNDALGYFGVFYSSGISIDL